MKQKSTFLIGVLVSGILLVLCHHGKAQEHQAHWFFGNECGIDFSSGAPVPVISPNINVLEGTSSFSDPNTGALLFYTDGVSAWDRNHNIMPACVSQIMGGHNSTTHGSVIIQKPDSLNMFYLFSCGAQAGAFDSTHPGITYSIVDMNLNGGNGDVVSMNIPLLDTATEKVAIIPNCEAKYYWILTHPWNTDSFYAFKLSSTGISTPIKSKAGQWITGPNASNSAAIGQMQVSPSGDKLCLANLGMMTIQLFDFNKNTGVVSSSNVMTDSNYTNLGPYGCCFSGDGTKLYTTEYSLISAKLNQYNISAGNSAAILASRTSIVNSTTLTMMAGLQRAMDDKIYVSIYGQNTLGVINNPNVMGAGCNFNSAGFTLGSSSETRSGLPTTYQQICYDTAIVIPQNLIKISDKDAIKIYPNPSTSAIYISGLPSNEAYPLRIYSSAMRLVMSSDCRNDVKIDLGDLVSGLYFVQVGSSFNKVIIDK